MSSTNDLAFLLGLGVIGILFALEKLNCPDAHIAHLSQAVSGAVVFLAIYNVSLVWILVALVSLGLFVESIMQRSSQGRDADFDDVAM